MSAEPSVTGKCDTPTCQGRAEAITPEGYVCDECAAELAAHYESVRERDQSVGGSR